MPLVTQEISESLETIVRPVIYAVSRDILERTGLDVKSSVFVNKGDDSAITTGTALDTEEEVKFAQSRETINVEMEEEVTEAALMIPTLPNTDTFRIFEDNRLGVDIRPIYVETKVTLSVSMTFASESAAKTWQNKIIRKVGNGNQHQRHTATYQAPIPREFMYILAELFKLREANAGYGEKFAKWLKDCWSEKIVLAANQAGNQRHFVLEESQTGFNGWYTFTQPPAIVQNTQNWTASFSYEFEYQKLTAMAMRYPLLIHNTLVPKQLRISGENFNELRGPAYSNITKSRYDRLDKGPIVPGSSIGGISIPHWDEWLPSYVRANYSTLLRIMARIKEGSRIFGDLTTLPNPIAEPLLSYMKTNHEDLVYDGRTPILVCIYKNDELISSKDVYVDENLVVHSTVALDPRATYKVWLGALVDLDTLQGNHLLKLLESGDTLRQVVSIIDSDYNLDGLPTLDDGSVFKGVWDKEKLNISVGGRHFNRDVEKNVLTVGNFIVAGKRP